ncbi:hypothetical protein PAHAL_8G101800 [Panicum hallii]|uniref:Uncharacterized protein n=1 Tax=Panicum hallii TaxID=206008 RepID=A0A2S3IDM3_9POAL|nr:hypothetical protein PAHAL_8G101800 [Panicum hallii]
MKQARNGLPPFPPPGTKPYLIPYGSIPAHSRSRGASGAGGGRRGTSPTGTATTSHFSSAVSAAFSPLAGRVDHVFVDYFDNNPHQICREQKRPPPSAPRRLCEGADFVKELKTYFADVGAFELPEEEVSDSELERELNLIPEYMTFLFFSCIEVVY